MSYLRSVFPIHSVDCRCGLRHSGRGRCGIHVHQLIAASRTIGCGCRHCAAAAVIVLGVVRLLLLLCGSGCGCGCGGCCDCGQVRRGRRIRVWVVVSRIVVRIMRVMVIRLRWWRGLRVIVMRMHFHNVVMRNSEIRIWALEFHLLLNEQF